MKRLKRFEGSPGYKPLAPLVRNEMSTDSPLSKNPLSAGRVLPSIAGGLRSAVVRPVTTAAFWLAVVLPFLHVPLLATGLESADAATAFGALLGLNALALVVGHPHASGQRSE